MAKVIDGKNSVLYARIAGDIEQQIVKKVWGVGDKLPSLRSICRQYKVSQSTAIQAYHHLETKWLVQSRPQSGYFVCNAPRRLPPVPQTSRPADVNDGTGQQALINKVYHNHGGAGGTSLSLGVPAVELLPVAKLNKGVVKAVRGLKGSGVCYEEVQGNEKLRRQVARWSAAMGASLGHDDIVVTAGCLSAIAWCLMALAQRGDTVAMESPVSFGMLQVAQSLGLQVMELPTHPQTGVELDALKKAFEKGKIKACLLISNFSNPLGSCMPDEHKKEAATLAEKHHIPLIENDLNADVYFGTHRPTSCKAYDESGMVLWCGSVSKTLAPGYRVGWVAPGRFKEEVMRMKLHHSISSVTITQEVIADFLETGQYETHLRKLRHVLHANSLQYSRAIADYFPQGTMASRPQGGFVLWAELDESINTAELYEKAVRHNISFAPGRMFTLQNQFDHCMRLNFGLTWNGELENALKTLGRLAHKHL